MKGISTVISYLKTAAAPAVVAASLAGTAHADPINYLPKNTDVHFEYSGLEVLVTASNQQLYGIVNVSEIVDAGNGVPYWMGDGSSDGTQLVGFFYGLNSTVSGSTVTYTGGHFVLYDVPNGSYNPGAAPNADPTALANREALLCGGAACPSAWATADFVPGILDSTGDTTVSLENPLIPPFPNDVAGSGYLNMSIADFGYGVGTNNAKFDSNQYTFTYNSPADLFLDSALAACPPSSTGCDAHGWDVLSNDPIFARTVPEPGTLALLALGVLGLGYSRLRKPQW